MLTQSFYIESPKESFINNFKQWFDRNHLEYPTYEDEKFEQFIKDMWENYGDDIMNFLAGEFGEDIWSEDEVIFIKAVIDRYIEYCHDYPHHHITVETFWKENIFSAMDANEDSFNIFDKDE